MNAARRCRAAAACLATAALALGAAGCDAVGDGATTVTVYAAASLQEPFEEIGEQFETAHEGVDVQFSFAGSSTLVEQVQQGAPADVLASADSSTMGELVDSGLQAADPVDFTTNTLMIAVPAGNPAHVTDLASLTEDDIDLVVCAPAVPCGAATESVEEAAGVDLAPVSEEQSVTDVLNKVTSGEADAGLVYATDVLRGGDAVAGIAFPESDSAVNTYPITTVKGSAQPELGQEFVDLVTGESGQQMLGEYGFGGS
ncbi:Molybdenum ABC transporter, periplasmic molybdenum-binding protein ModA (TC 3.A.1.8.1) [Corynebacterium xerosis]|nr:Molybdenum ABC transporter, periplasmic molybdenum-binding protein ModA (TC 3.A.1.8.1) [Corynebacterium xerosis]